MRSAITVSLVPEARSGPFVFHEDLDLACARASALGFEAIELFPPSADIIDARALRQVLHRNRLELAAVGTGAGWVTRKLSLTSPDAALREQARLFVSAIIDFAGGFGAPAILGSMQGRAESEAAREGALHWLAQALEQLGPRAHAHGVPLLLEPLNRYESNLLNTIEQTLAFLRPLRTQNIRILADLFHLNIEEASIPDALRLGAAQIGHVHLADSNRLAFGLGHTDGAGIRRALLDIGYAGYLSAEVFPRPNPETAAARTLQTIQQWNGRSS